ncbi:MAG: hypothetical protein ACT4OV_05225 [Microthrixaceae bacterium]
MTAVLAYVVAGAGVASADPIGAGSASAFAATADVFATNVIPPTPTAETAAPAADETNNTVIGIPGDPLIVNGTLIARSAVHAASDLPSELNQTEQPVAGPYNARSIGQIEDLSVLINEGVPGGSLVSADLIRAEAVAVCTAGSVQYSASSEVVDLQIGGQDPFSGPLNEALEQITTGLAPLADLISVELNVVTPSATGVSVDAVVVTLLQAAADNGAPGALAKVVLGHAQVQGVGCAAAPAPPQCSDTTDNDGDNLIDAADPGCHTDGDAGNSDSYDPTDDDERNTDVLAGGPLPSDGALPLTGGTPLTGLGVLLGAGALGLFALRRKLLT